jgi:hypothetical protein
VRSEDPLADVQQALDRAEEGDRRAQVVLGANWRHDSRALAARLHRSPLAEIIQQHYELEFIHVGFYELDRAVRSESLRDRSGNAPRIESGVNIASM